MSYLPIGSTLTKNPIKLGVCIGIGIFLVSLNFALMQELDTYNCATDIPTKGTLKNPTAQDIVDCESIMGTIQTLIVPMIFVIGSGTVIGFTARLVMVKLKEDKKEA